MVGRLGWTALLVLALCACSAASRPGGPGGPGADPASVEPVAGALTVQGNRVVDEEGTPFGLTGFNVAGTEYACAEGDGVFDGPDNRSMPDEVVRAMTTWRGASVVRVPLNQQCWLGITTSPRFGGPVYRQAIADYVGQLRRQGFAVILDLHRSAPGQAAALHQEPMPDRDHSVEFWRQVATAYRGDTGVLFDLFNEPNPLAGSDSPEAWRCWRDGGCTLDSANTGRPYVAAGMQELLDAVGSTGAVNIAIAGGVRYAEAMARWWEFRPEDPAGNLVAATHVYSFNECSTTACLEATIGPLTRQVPVLIGELGPDLVTSTGLDARCPAEDVGRTGFAAAVLDWAAGHGVGWLAWTWNPWGDCWALVQDWSGSPTPIWGELVRERLAAG
jgi:hypothetical protein